MKRWGIVSSLIAIMFASVAWADVGHRAHAPKIAAPSSTRNGKLSFRGGEAEAADAGVARFRHALAVGLSTLWGWCGWPSGHWPIGRGRKTRARGSRLSERAK